MSRPPLSATIIARDEEGSIGRAIQSVAWADEVLVVDSGSTDRTREIAREMGARVIENPWPGYGKQKNFAQSQAKYDWVLNLDADEVVSPELRAAIEIALAAPRVNGFRIPRRTYYLGRWIRRGGWYPNYLVRLADRRHARWTEPEVHEELKVEGELGELAEPFDHYGFESIEDQIHTNLRFSRLGAKGLEASGKRPSVVLLLLKPWWKFVETYFIKGGWLDGIAGLIISVNAAHSMFLKYAYLFEKRIRRHANPDHR